MDKVEAIGEESNGNKRPPGDKARKPRAALGGICEGDAEEESGSEADCRVKPETMGEVEVTPAQEDESKNGGPDEIAGRT